MLVTIEHDEGTEDSCAGWRIFAGESVGKYKKGAFIRGMYDTRQEAERSAVREGYEIVGGLTAPTGLHAVITGTTVPTARTFGATPVTRKLVHMGDGIWMVLNPTAPRSRPAPRASETDREALTLVEVTEVHYAGIEP